MIRANNSLFQFNKKIILKKNYKIFQAIKLINFENFVTNVKTIKWKVFRDNKIEQLETPNIQEKNEKKMNQNEWGKYLNVLETRTCRRNNVMCHKTIEDYYQ